MKQRITHVRRDNHGRIVEVKTDHNNIYDIEIAKEFAANNEIENALVEITVNTGFTILNSLDYDYFTGYPEF